MEIQPERSNSNHAIAANVTSAIVVAAWVAYLGLVYVIIRESNVLWGGLFASPLCLFLPKVSLMLLRKFGIEDRRSSSSIADDIVKIINALKGTPAEAANPDESIKQADLFELPVNNVVRSKLRDHN
ncbi:hypothetical protein [Maricaulis alexandrii]|uniref:hypothetical protein n=1 Tax=Maricaulis alexandrii TaxID=2570354 RepID=UPI0011097325|nr:hypothetical protein [Maricaulis alexandrii]